MCSKRVTLKQMFVWVHVDLVLNSGKENTRMSWKVIELLTVKIRAFCFKDMLYDQVYSQVVWRN